jgi:tetratricopeptide (TPR) repeat protein
MTERRRSRALPLWSKGSIILGVALALLAAFLTRTLAQRGDWTDGALAVALAAMLLAGVTLLVGIARALAGRRSRWTLLQTALLIIVLQGSAAVSFFGASSLHATQARYAMREGQWAEAASEFALSGERAPNAPGIAGAFVAWGESLLAQRQYASAAEKFVPVITAYAGSGHALIAKAHDDLFRTYSQWIRGDARQVSYGGVGGALDTFQTYLSDPRCDAGCQTQLTATVAQAHYEYGQQLLASQRYSDAISQFETVIAKYAGSVYAGQARAVAAQAYLALGQQQIARVSCADAVATYRALVAHYGDTPQAATAKTALAAPQPVSGTFSGMPTSPAPMVALSSQVNVSGYIFSDDYTNRPDASGAFTIPNVAQGKYNLSTKRDVDNAVTYTYYHDAKGDVYTVHVEPLCPVRLGVIAYKS